MLTIIAFILVLGLLIFAHEMGHFVTAKAAGVKVNEFGFGYPPRLFAIRHGETEYSVNLLPLGGFVRMAGEEEPSSPDSFASKGIGTRLLILSSGPIMNALLPILLFSLSFMIPQQIVVSRVQIEQVMSNSPAASAGFEPGDIVLSINNRPVKNTADLAYNIHLSLGRETKFQLEGAGGIPKTVVVVPRWSPPPEEGAIGIVASMTDVHLATESYPPWKAIPLGMRAILDTPTLVKNEVITWFARKTPPQLTGPVGIFQLTGEAAGAGVAPLLAFAAFLSINLAVINLLPLPALDGGRIAFVIVEAVRRGKRISPQRERLVHLIGFVLLITLVIIVTYNDILRAMRGESLLP